MSSSVYDTDNTLVQLTMVLKMQNLQRGQLPSLSYENLEDFLNQCLWKRGCPSSLHEAADQILHINAAQIVRFLSKKAIIDGAHADLEDFSDIIGGN